MIFIINFIIKLKLILFQNPFMKYITPQKTSFRQNIDTSRSKLGSDSKLQSKIPDLERRFNQSSITRIDYKAKTFQLMANVSQLQNRQKSYEQTIFFLQRELQKINRQIQFFLSSLGAKNLTQAAQKIIKPQIRRNTKTDNQIDQQYSKILQEYKQIINKQQQKFLKIQAKYKESNQKHKKHQKQKQILKKEIQNFQQQLRQHKLLQTEIDLLKTQNKSLQQKNKGLQQMNKSLQQKLSDSVKLSQQKQTKIQDQVKQIKSLKNELKFFLQQKTQVQEKYQNLKFRYKQEINHFQQIQNEVEIKLIQVEKEMNAYRQEKEEHLHQIKMLKQELRVRQQQREFSFGGFEHSQTQTDQLSNIQQQEQYLPSFNMECYQTSIKSLLEQNNRLKNALINLTQRNQGQQLSAQAELELKLLIGVKQLRKQVNFQKQNKGVIQKNKQQKILSQIQEAGQKKLTEEIKIKSDQNQININEIQNQNEVQ